MRIRPRPAQRNPRQQVGEWTRSHPVIVRVTFGAVLAIALAVAAGLWYRSEGHEILRPFLPSFLGGADSRANELPTLRLELGLETYRTLLSERNSALQRGMPPGEAAPWLEVEIQFQGRSIPARLRLDGDNADHWQADKWSWQIQTQGQASLLGMRAFSARSPALSGYLDAWLYAQSLREAGVLAPRHAFVNLYVNEQSWGIYALREEPSPALLDAQGRPPGAVVHWDDSLLLRWQSNPGAQGPAFADPVPHTLAPPAVVSIEDPYAPHGDPASQARGAAAIELLQGFADRQLAPSQAFDPVVAGRYLAQADLWAACDDSAWRDEWFYYDPSSERLEPVGSGTRLFASECAGPRGLGPYDDLAIMGAYAREAARISQPEYLAGLREDYGAQFERYRDALAQEFYPAYLQAPWEKLAERQRVLSAALHPPQTVYASLVGNGGSAIDLQVSNLLRYPVALTELRSGGRSTALQPEWVAEGDRALVYHGTGTSLVLRPIQLASPQPVTLQIPEKAWDELLVPGVSVYSGTLQLISQLPGVEGEIVVEVWQPDSLPPSASALPAQPSLGQALAQHPFLVPSDQPGFLELRSGDWKVEGDLVLPAGVGLRATKPVTLAFDEGAVLFATAPLLFRGATEGGIYLVPQEEHWAGIYVYQAPSHSPSLLSRVEVRGTQGIHRPGWVASGGVTFYASPVIVDRCRLIDSLAQDALHVVGARFDVTDTEFANASLDALGSDAAQGRIARSAFHDVLGKGVDATASAIALEGVNLLRIYDQGISAGQGSTVHAAGLRIRDVGTAVASKDMSYVEVRDVHIAQAWVAGFAAYLDRASYGPSSIRAVEVLFEDDSLPALAQRGSAITLDGSPVPLSDGRLEPERGLQPAQPIQAVNYRFGPAIRLLGYTLTVPDPLAGGALECVLYWQALAKLNRDYTVFVHIVDAAGQIAAQRDAMPREDAFPTTQWPVGERIDDRRLVPLPLDLAPGEYRVVLGIYYLQTGERLPLQGPDGEAIPNGALMLEQKLQVGS